MSAVEAPLTITLIEALARAWSEQQTPIEIGSDVEKVRLLRRVAQECRGQAEVLSPELRLVYQDVFLRAFEEVAQPTGQ
jgi:hypothetical protein